MAETIEAKQERSTGATKKARRKAADAPSGKTTGKASLKKGVKAEKVAKRSRKTKQEETAGEVEEKSLRVAASKSLGRNKENLARHLLNETLHGNGHSAKLLLALAETKTGHKGEEQERPYQSLALLLESEPEWRGEQSEEAAETGHGGLEPEAVEE